MPNWEKKTVTITIEIRSPLPNADVARAVASYLEHGSFREGISVALEGSLGDEFEVLEGSTVDVETQA